MWKKTKMTTKEATAKKIRANETRFLLKNAAVVIHLAVMRIVIKMTTKKTTQQVLPKRKNLKSTRSILAKRRKKKRKMCPLL